MKWAQWIEQWGLTGLRINTGVLSMDFNPTDPDRQAAWEMYVELLTRVTTQYLEPEHGDEQTALASVHSLFPLTRDTLKRNGRMCNEFAKIAIVVLNQVVRPFTAKWHRLQVAGAFDDKEQCAEFREELAELQQRLRQYTKMLADMAGVEDLTDLESG
ncbi:hypothetical protein MYX78_04855 [Acidobacteria bacterium AH-259-G07]|nr:hypothetical protein [Acidobacteria bacterium AH-259-G07]